MQELVIGQLFPVAGGERAQSVITVGTLAHVVGYTVGSTVRGNFELQSVIRSTAWAGCSPAAVEYLFAKRGVGNRMALAAVVGGLAGFVVSAANPYQEPADASSQ